MESLALTNKLVVVFGGTGFLGTYVVSELVRRGYMVRVASRRPSRGDNLKVAGAVGQVTSVYCDITGSVESLEASMVGAYAVVNLVGINHESKNSSFMNINAKAAESLAQTATRIGIKRFVHISTMMAVGSPSVYLRSKVLGENAVRKVAPISTILRPGMIIGLGSFNLHIIAKVLHSLPLFPLMHCGRLQPVLASDMARAIAISIDIGLEGRSYNVIGDKTYSLADIVDLVASSMDLVPRYIRMNKSITKVLSFILNSWLVRIALSPFTSSYKPLLTPDQVETASMNFTSNDRSSNFFTDLNVASSSVAYTISNNEWYDTL